MLPVRPGIAFPRVFSACIGFPHHLLEPMIPEPKKLPLLCRDHQGHSLAPFPSFL
jgi:hypothetical protein